ncbi:MAG: SPOR domain-containing protein [Deltaproteobacteria bacterium]|nr:SPOR domain-containing protein [Deltaproteobacteria bacterium]
MVGDAPGAVKTVSSGKYYVQVGAFSVEENANSTIRQLRNRGYGARSLYSSSMRLWRVQVGPYPDLGRAEAASRDFEREGVQNFVVTD